MAAGAGQRAIEKQLKICGYKRDADVSVLYLAGQGLKVIPSLSRFRMLKYLWLNNNKIQEITFLINNYCLTELYLNNNDLRDIAGALKHLSSLQVLLLHNNQLKHLDKTVKELTGMISLQTLNLFHNPLSQDPMYRLYVIYFLPSVQLLDRKKITQKEKESALHIYNHERSCVLQSIAFGKRINKSLVAKTVSSRSIPAAQSLQMPPVNSLSRKLYADRLIKQLSDLVPSGACMNHSLSSIPKKFLSLISVFRCEMTPRENYVPTCGLNYPAQNKDYEFANHVNKVPFENPEDAVFVRAMKRSIMEFSCVDWNKIPTYQEKHLENKLKEPCEKVTIRFR